MDKGSSLSWKPGVTCLLCGDQGGHTSAQHYSVLAPAARPDAVSKAMDRIESETGTRPKLAEVMSACGVGRRP